MDKYSSSSNQEIIGEFVNDNVLANVTSIVDFILVAAEIVDNAPFKREDFSNSYYYADSKGNIYSEDQKEEQLTEWEEELEEINESLENDLENLALEALQSKIEDSIFELRNAEMEYAEPLEYWAVTEFLATKLNQHAEITFTDGYNSYWGRTTSGQSIKLDSVIEQICSDLGILTDQSRGNLNSSEGIGR